jgi:hypothetical protein
MNTKKFFKLLFLAMLSSVAITPVLIHLRGIPLNEFFNGILILALYGFLFAAVFLCFGLILLGVFAVYRVIYGLYQEKGMAQVIL